MAADEVTFLRMVLSTQWTDLFRPQSPNFPIKSVLQCYIFGVFPINPNPQFVNLSHHLALPSPIVCIGVIVACPGLLLVANWIRAIEDRSSSQSLLGR
jgi:hypothetical protein